MVALASGCESAQPRGPGSIDVTSNATSLEQAFFIYGVAIDSGTPQTGFTGVPLHFVQRGMAHGAHVVTVSGAPTVCTGTGAQAVNLRGDDTVRVTIAIQCPRTTGDVAVSVATTGFDFDADGYIVAVDGIPRGLVAASASAQFTAHALTPTNHVVSLTDVASNCTVAANNQSVSVTAGVTANVSFAVSCAKVAAIRFSGAMTGVDRDPDGFVLSVDGAAGTPGLIAGSTPVRVASGSHTWAISDVQANCTLVGPATGSATLAEGDTITVDLSASCAAIPAGTVGWSLSDPVGDTLTESGFSGPTSPLDVVSVSGRYATGWLTVVLHFTTTVTSAANGSLAQGLFGTIDLDVDELASTGIQPLANTFGGTASMGADYSVPLSLSDTSSTELYRRTPTSSVLVGRVRTTFSGDSVVYQIPLAKLSDDGNMVVSLIVGTQDRPTDFVPNSGAISGHLPPSAIVLPVAPARAIRAVPMGASDKRKSGAWVPKP